MSNEQNVELGALATIIANDRDLLARCEQVIDLALRRYNYEAGKALHVIRTRRLYLQEHNTFEEYCRDRWQMTRQHANRAIAAAEAVGDVQDFNGKQLSNVEQCAPIPTTQRQAEALTKAPREQRGPVMAKASVKAAAEGKPVTARHVQEAVDEIIPQAKVPTRPGATGKRAAGVSSFDAGADVDPDEESIDLGESREMGEIMAEWGCSGRANGGGRQRDRVAEYLRAFAAWIERQ